MGPVGAPGLSEPDHANCVTAAPDHEGRTVWRGVVELSEHQGPHRVKLSYAWSHIAKGQARIIAASSKVLCSAPGEPLRRLTAPSPSNQSTAPAYAGGALPGNAG